MIAELREQLQAVMATLAKEPAYYFFGIDGGVILNGRSEVEAYYKEMFSMGRMNAEFDIHRIVVDEHAVVTEGSMLSLVDASELVQAGINEVGGAKVTIGSSYLSRVPLLVVWPVTDDGRLVGENIYLGGGRYDRLELADQNKPDATV
jgi:limonene-1,2-epoxide hydrolase